EAHGPKRPTGSLQPDRQAHRNPMQSHLREQEPEPYGSAQAAAQADGQGVDGKPGLNPVSGEEQRGGDEQSPRPGAVGLQSLRINDSAREQFGQEKAADAEHQQQGEGLELQKTAQTEARSGSDSRQA